MTPGARYVFVARVAYSSAYQERAVHILFKVEVGPAEPAHVELLGPTRADQGCPIRLQAKALQRNTVFCSSRSRRLAADENATDLATLPPDYPPTPLLSRRVQDDDEESSTTSTTTTTTTTTTTKRFTPEDYAEEMNAFNGSVTESARACSYFFS